MRDEEDSEEERTRDALLRLFGGRTNNKLVPPNFPNANEVVDFVICATVDMSAFTDNVHSTCALCERPIVHRPNVPPKPKKICIFCAADLPERKMDA